MKQNIKMCGGRSRKNIKCGEGGASAEKIKSMGGVREKIKMGGGRPGFFTVRTPLRISNGIALTWNLMFSQLLLSWPVSVALTLTVLN